jgi:DNA-binding NarL/FixJ family response regulator
MENRCQPIGVQAGKRRILVVDDHPIVREGMSLLISREPDLAICGTAEEAAEALRLIELRKPNLVILDISLGGPDGLEALKMIRARSAALPVLMLSMHDEETYAERALRAGANGYITKQRATDKVLTAIRRILAGDIYVSERVADRVLQRLAAGDEPDESPISKLSDRELEVFRFIAEGWGARQIAEDLHLSVKTVETYEAHLKEKLSLGSVRELMRFAVEWRVQQG